MASKLVGYQRWIIAVLVLAVAVVTFLPFANLIFAAHLAWVLRGLASGATGENLSVDQVKVRRRMGNRELEALVYSPKGYPPTRALVFVAGISELGCYHPRLIALSRYLANEGFLVVTPDVPEFRRFEVSAEPIDQIVFWFQQVRTLEASRRVKRIGLAGISFSATLSLIAASRPEIRNEVAFFLGIGPYYDLHQCVRYWFAAGPAASRGEYYPTRFYAKWIIMNAALGVLPDLHDRVLVHGVLLDLLLQKKVPPADPSLTPEGRRWYQLAVMHEGQADDELSREIEACLDPFFFRPLDPEQAGSEVRCPVFLVHGAYDDLIPPSQSLEMKQHITGASCYLLITPFLTHTHPLDEPITWRQKVRAISESLEFLYRFARALR